MKVKYIFLSSIVLLLFNSYAYGQDSLIVGLHKKENGVYIFIDSKPIKKYKVLGSILSVWASTYLEAKEALIQKALKKYPDTEALIIEFFPSNTSYVPKADAIKFIE